MTGIHTFVLSGLFLFSTPIFSADSVAFFTLCDPDPCPGKIARTPDLFVPSDWVDLFWDDLRLALEYQCIPYKYWLYADGAYDSEIFYFEDGDIVAIDLSKTELFALCDMLQRLYRFGLTSEWYRNALLYCDAKREDGLPHFPNLIGILHWFINWHMEQQSLRALGLII